MRMDKYNKYKKYKMSSRTERMLHYSEDVYNNIIDYLASIVALFDENVDSKYSSRAESPVKDGFYE